MLFSGSLYALNAVFTGELNYQGGERKTFYGAEERMLMKLVVDGTTGQNAIMQAKVFTESIQVTGIFLAKLDGTAKGGIVFAIADQLGIPVRYVGIGESAEDFGVFDAASFVDAVLTPARAGGEAA